MKKLLTFLAAILLTVSIVNAKTCSCKNCEKANANLQAKNEVVVSAETKKIIRDVQLKTSKAILKGKGPFYAVIYDDKGNIVAEAANSVVEDKCCLYHAEINAIKAACAKLGTYDLAPYNLSIYINAEPCIMCTGAIMWSGIKHVYYGVPSKNVEKITGFDEGFKPMWHEEFNKRGITVQGNIETKAGELVLKQYMESGKEIYKPSR